MTSAPTTPEQRLSPFQQSALQVPEACNLALLGARGGGKTTAAVYIALQHIAKYQSDASVLIVRSSYKSLTDFEDELLSLLGQATGNRHRYNRAEKVARIDRATIRLAAVQDQRSYDVLQGANATLLIVDEVTQYPTERLLRLLRSNLRGPDHVITRVVYLGNPGGPLHGRIFKNHVQDRQSHVPYEINLDDGETERWVTIPSGPLDNPFIDQNAYVNRLRQACHGDPVRLKQWLFGEWSVGEGLMFDMFDPDVHTLGLPENFAISRDAFTPYTATDWGISSPSVCLVGGRAKRAVQIDENQLAPRGSVLVFDEVTDAITDNPEDLSKSLEWSPSRLGEKIVARCASLGWARPTGVIDSARGLRGESLHVEVRKEGFWDLRPPRKGRRSEGHATIRSMLTAAAEQDPSRPHLYISDRCEYLLATLPQAVRDEKDPDDIRDTPHCPDHAIDPLRYLLSWAVERPTMRTGRTVGLT